MPQPTQPLLHDLVTVCAAPTQVLSGRDGAIVAELDGRVTAHGLFHADLRVLSGWSLQIGGESPAHLATDLDGAGEARFTYLADAVPGGDVDRMLRLDLTRTVTPGMLAEALVLTSELADVGDHRGPDRADQRPDRRWSRSRSAGTPNRSASPTTRAARRSPSAARR